MSAEPRPGRMHRHHERSVLRWLAGQRRAIHVTIK
jgi:hypothetical protein